MHALIMYLALHARTHFPEGFGRDRQAEGGGRGEEGREVGTGWGGATQAARMQSLWTVFFKCLRVLQDSLSALE